MWRMSFARYCAITSRRLSRVEAMHERCGAAGLPALRISSTVASVPSRVDPPAPYVTEKNAGSSCASCLRVARSFSIPWGVFGGKNSKLKTRLRALCDSTARDAARRAAGMRPRVHRAREIGVTVQADRGRSHELRVAAGAHERLEHAPRERGTEEAVVPAVEPQLG